MKGWNKIVTLVGVALLAGGLAFGAEEKSPAAKAGGNQKSAPENQPQKDKDKEPVKPKDEVKDKEVPPEKKEESKSEDKDKKESVLSWVTSYKEIKSRLETVEMSLEMTDQNVVDVVEYFQYTLNINFRITAQVYKDFSTKTVDLKLNKVKAKSALKMAIRQLGLKCLYEDGALVVMGPEETVTGEYITVIYRVDDLTTPPPPQYESPTIEQPFTAANGQPGIPPPPPPPPPPVKEVTKEDIKDFVMKFAGGDSWTKDKQHVAISITNRVLVVTQTSAVHREIIEALNRLRSGR